MPPFIKGPGGEGRGQDSWVNGRTLPEQPDSLGGQPPLCTCRTVLACMGPRRRTGSLGVPTENRIPQIVQRDANGGTTDRGGQGEGNLKAW